MGTWRQRVKSGSMLKTPLGSLGVGGDVMGCSVDVTPKLCRAVAALGEIGRRPEPR